MCALISVPALGPTGGEFELALAQMHGIIAPSRVKIPEFSLGSIRNALASITFSDCL